MARPDMEVVRIQQKRRFAIVFTCRHFQFDIFVPDIFLLIIHSTGTTLGGKNKQVMSQKNIPRALKKNLGPLPKPPHHLLSYNRITPICANAEVKINGEVLFRNCLSNCYGLVVEIGRNDLTVEKYTNVAGGRCFLQQSFIEQCPIDGIYALTKSISQGDK